MRYLLCALLLGGWMLGQGPPSQAPASKGMFYVDGIVYQFSVGANYAVVAAAHSAINHTIPSPAYPSCPYNACSCAFER
jgi:hypothetical protein